MAARMAFPSSTLPTLQPLQRERPFACPMPLCNGRFHRKYTLHEHMKTHTGEQPHQCPVPSCGKRFSTSGNLARHKRLHLLRKMACPVPGCTHIFTSHVMLAKHQRAHSSNSIHKCIVDGCGKIFSTSGNLTRHMKMLHRLVQLPPYPRQAKLGRPIQYHPHRQACTITSTCVQRESRVDTDTFDVTALAWVKKEPLFFETSMDHSKVLSDEDLKDLIECLF
ncbi:hypothetical protein PsorP6_010617 [Peronosclerospora sorghi]|uniref:Uncharacterized protein n=1 Tax=Peronosclerospora sorghi TaxID=230839 RepID=A0ACC0VVQ8_9STRA|nr:hypothetical protein PsorP6_010617 [Peronosclerospora sorghi]